MTRHAWWGNNFTVLPHVGIAPTHSLRKEGSGWSERRIKTRNVVHGLSFSAARGQSYSIYEISKIDRV